MVNFVRPEGNRWMKCHILHLLKVIFYLKCCHVLFLIHARLLKFVLICYTFELPFLGPSFSLCLFLISGMTLLQYETQTDHKELNLITSKSMWKINGLLMYVSSLSCLQYIHVGTCFFQLPASSELIMLEIYIAKPLCTWWMCFGCKWMPLWRVEFSWCLYLVVTNHMVC